VRFKLGENLPASAAAVLASAGHDVDTVAGEGLTGARDPDVVSAATGRAGSWSPWMSGWVTSVPIRPAITRASWLRINPTKSIS
jgi:hypothetical protein